MNIQWIISQTCIGSNLYTCARQSRAGPRRSLIARRSFYPSHDDGTQRARWVGDDFAGVKQLTEVGIVASRSPTRRRSSLKVGDRACDFPATEVVASSSQKVLNIFRNQKSSRDWPLFADSSHDGNGTRRTTLLRRRKKSSYLSRNSSGTGALEHIQA